MRDIVARCPQCRGGMQESTDAEGRKWHVCGKCGVQVPVESPSFLSKDITSIGRPAWQLPDMESYRKQENSMAEVNW